MKRIGVLTSGGDTPGMNAAIRAVFKTGVDIDLQVMGIYHGYKGLIEGRVGYLAHADVESKMHKGGTILRTARSEEFKTEGGIEKAISVLRAYEIEGLIVIGGDGSFKGADALGKRGIPVIGIPGTIDNDMGYTDFTIGFDTAVNNVMNEIYKIRDTMRAHDRVGVIEVMGRRCGCCRRGRHNSRSGTSSFMGGCGEPACRKQTPRTAHKHCYDRRRRGQSGGFL